MPGTEVKKKQWAWFVILWCAGILAAGLLGVLTRWIVRL